MCKPISCSKKVVNRDRMVKNAENSLAPPSAPTKKELRALTQNIEIDDILFQSRCYEEFFSK